MGRSRKSVEEITTGDSLEWQSPASDRARTWWREAVERVARGGPKPSPESLKRAWDEFGSPRETASWVFEGDVSDLRAVLEGNYYSQQNAHEAFVEEHGSRQELVADWERARDLEQELRKRIAQHDQLQRTVGMTLAKARVAKRNQRIFPAEEVAVG